MPLQMMGARIETHEGRPPVRIRGTPQLRGIDYSLPVASAQVKSALLLAGLAAERTHARDRAGALARSHRAHAGRLRRAAR